MYKAFFKSIFFQLDAEKAHHIALAFYKFALNIPGFGRVNDKIYLIDTPQLEKNLFGLHFKNPVGLAAGFDKNAEYIPLMARLGFGFIEIGTVTPKAQRGNNKPRLFRLPDDEALINRMGFNNKGAEVVIKNLTDKKTIQTKEKYKVLIGGNIGKNKETPNEDAWKDYAECFKKLFEHVDYFVVNVSSPNTPALRELQDKNFLKEILSRLQEINQKNKPKPLLLKIAPDLNSAQVDSILEIVLENKLTGIVIANTTLNRNNLKTSGHTLVQAGEGGLSGKPLFAPSNNMLSNISRKTGKKLVLIASGGIFNAADVNEKINCGASLVQIYTGLIYEGPSIVKNILKEM